MVKVHEVAMGVREFEGFRDSDYAVLRSEGVEKGDYILFKQVEESGSETGLHRMTRVSDLVSGEGFADGYALAIVRTL